ncbi:Geranylgeranyl pyrophosphate synthetase [Coniochaeta hoffmannii]|uniref:Geranylgeranyl pyrophosphate synthetase n=1 Tax=Coniochaeta hoffmannii TaxID=91930 RepID=A0AA38VMU3_9PEZI|nr:Geranylgeranyl pyrophosphate synthetase [Coniochaeta hoffmannii]
MNDRWKSGRWASQSSLKQRYKPRTDDSSVTAPPLGQLIQMLEKSDLQMASQDYLDKASIHNCELVTSYNWLDKTEPTMLIPGNPPRWTPQPGEVTLPQDSGVYFRDKNASRYPFHLMESTVLAALNLDPNLPADLDIVACYSSLGHLIRFALGKEKSFRILVQAVDSTVFFVRRENSPTEKLEGIKGYGHTFPEAHTTWDPEMKGSDTSHRILKYSFGGLRMLVRAEADAYVPDRVGQALPSGSSSRPAAKTASASPSTTSADIADLTQYLQGLLSTETTIPSPSPSPSIPSITTISSSPTTPIPQSQILEIKTRTLWKETREDTVAEEMPKLWLAQIPNFLVAYHDRGTFPADVPVQDVRPRVERWERLARRDLAAFAALLHEVIRLVRGRQDGKLELCRSGMGGLEVREQLGDAGEVLSAGLKERWRDGNNNSGNEGDGVVADLDASDDDPWEDGQDWTFCSVECEYCGWCKNEDSS